VLPTPQVFVPLYVIGHLVLGFLSREVKGLNELISMGVLLNYCGLFYSHLLPPLSACAFALWKIYRLSRRCYKHIVMILQIVTDWSHRLVIAMLTPIHKGVSGLISTVVLSVRVKILWLGL